jgi:hypothetical protein
MLRARIKDLGLRGRSRCWARSARPTSWTTWPAAAPVLRPWNEDYGFVTLEAFASARRCSPPATAAAGGAGGAGTSGLVAAPTADSVADQLDTLANDRGLTERLGQAALLVPREHTWERRSSSWVRRRPHFDGRASIPVESVIPERTRETTA